MKRQDEKDLMVYLQNNGDIDDFQMNLFRLHHILNKWIDEGLWEDGPNFNTFKGYLTQDGDEIDVEDW